jgi:hypothetical protein
MDSHANVPNELYYAATDPCKDGHRLGPKSPARREGQTVTVQVCERTGCSYEKVESIDPPPDDAA